MKLKTDNQQRKLIKMANAYMQVSFKKIGPIPKLDSAYCCTLLQCPENVNSTF